jgi:hypothetical protein
MRARNVGSCPECMRRQPFSRNDKKIEPGREYHFECEGCGKMIEVFCGHHNMTVGVAKDQQRKLFE